MTTEPGTAGSRNAGKAFWLPLVVALALPAVLYVLTLYPGVGGRANTGDSAKFQYIGEVLGVPHQPGYPQYVWLNFLFTRLPLPLSLASKVNLLSAVFSLCAGGLFFALVRRLSRSSPVAVLSTWTLLLSPAVWIFSTEAEVYSLHMLYVVAVAFLGYRWLATRRDRWLALLAAVYILSFSHHTTTVTLLPAIGWLVWVVDRRALLGPEVIKFATVALLATAALYGFVWLRSYDREVFVEGIEREASLAELAASVSGRRFTEKNVLRQGPQESLGRLRELPGEAGRQVTWPVVILAIAGLASLRRQPAYRGFLVLGALGPIALLAIYHIGDWKGYLPPIWIMLIALAALGVLRIPGALLRHGVVALWALMVGWNATQTYGAVKVEENPFERSALVELAGQNAVVVAYRGPGYRAKQLGNYYEHGLRLGETRDLQFRSAGVVFDQQFQFLENKPLIFNTHPVLRYFDRHRVDYERKLHPTQRGEYYYETVTNWPVASVTISPSAAGHPTVVDDRGEVLISFEDPGAIVVAVLDPEQERVRGVKWFEFEEVGPASGKASVLSFMRKVKGGDFLIVASRAPAGHEEEEAFALLMQYLLHPLAKEAYPEQNLVAAGVKRTFHKAGFFATDLSETVNLKLHDG